MVNLFRNELSTHIFSYPDPNGHIRWKAYANDKDKHIHALIHSNPKSIGKFKPTRFVDTIKPGKIPEWIKNWIYETVRESFSISLEELQAKIDDNPKILEEFDYFIKIQVENLKDRSKLEECRKDAMFFGCKTLKLMLERMGCLKIIKNGVIIFKSLSEKSSKSSIKLVNKNNGDGSLETVPVLVTQYLKQFEIPDEPEFTFKLTKFFSPS